MAEPSTHSLDIPASTALPSSPSISIELIPSPLTVPLRHSVLWPSKPPSFVLLDEDDLPTTTHLGAFLQLSSDPFSTTERLPSSILTLVPSPFPLPPLSKLTSTTLRFRKFATDPVVQGQGLGSSLLERVWQLARESGSKLVWCDARVETKAWYERRGMRVEGAVLLKEGKEYVRMVRDIEE